MKVCNSEYAFDLIKNCKFGVNKDIQHRTLECKCKNRCATCSVGSGLGTKMMHPDLYAKWVIDVEKQISENVKQKNYLISSMELVESGIVCYRKCSRCGESKDLDHYKTCFDCREKSRLARLKGIARRKKRAELEALRGCV